MLAKNEKGFTLVELLVVIAIIGILAIVAVPALFSNINKAKATDVVADVRSIKTAAMSIYAENSKESVDKLNEKTNVGDGTLAEDLEIQDFSGEGEYTITASNNPSRATVKIVVDNDDIGKKACEQLGGTELKSEEDGRYAFEVTLYDGASSKE